MLPFVPFAAGVAVGVVALKWFKQSQDARAKAAPVADEAAAPAADEPVGTSDTVAPPADAEAPAADKPQPRKARGGAAA